MILKTILAHIYYYKYRKWLILERKCYIQWRQGNFKCTPSVAWSLPTWNLTGKFFWGFSVPKSPENNDILVMASSIHFNLRSRLTCSVCLWFRMLWSKCIHLECNFRYATINSYFVCDLDHPRIYAPYSRLISFRLKVNFEILKWVRWGFCETN